MLMLDVILYYIMLLRYNGNIINIVCNCWIKVEFLRLFIIISTKLILNYVILINSIDNIIMKRDNNITKILW